MLCADGPEIIDELLQSFGIQLLCSFFYVLQQRRLVFRQVL